MTSVSDPVPVSIRDAFYKITDNPTFAQADLIRAEDTSAYYIRAAAYADLLQFETDLAQICDLILLFCESESSFSELGAFAMVDEIADKLLVIIQSQYYREETFITLGPIAALKNRHDSAVYVIDDSDVGIVGNSFSLIDKNVLRDRLKSPIEMRLTQVREHTRFEANRSGHIIKLIVGLVQEFGALSRTEILRLLPVFDVSCNADRLSGYILCASAVGWIAEDRKGSIDYCFSLSNKDAATLTLEKGEIPSDKARRRLTYREHWASHDQDRYRGIVEYQGRMR